MTPIFDGVVTFVTTILDGVNVAKNGVTSISDGVTSISDGVGVTTMDRIMASLASLVGVNNVAKNSRTTNIASLAINLVTTWFYHLVIK